MTIHLYTICYNEMDILPFCVDYWKRFASHVTVYDNGSTDGSIEFLSQFDWIDVRHFDTDDTMDTQKQTNVKNLSWKESKGKADWVVVCDTDELLFSNNLEDVLTEMKEGGYSALGNKWYELVGTEKPQYEEGKLLHELIPRVIEQKTNFQDRSIGKIMLFDPNKIEDMGYGVGCHKNSPRGTYKLFNTDKVITIHVNKGFGVEYRIRANKERNARRSPENRRRGYGLHYAYSEAKVRKEYEANSRRAVDVSTVIVPKKTPSTTHKLIGPRTEAAS